MSIEVKHTSEVLIRHALKRSCKPTNNVLSNESCRERLTAAAFPGCANKSKEDVGQQESFPQLKAEGLDVTSTASWASQEKQFYV